MKNELYKEWIIKAQNDLESAKILYRENGPTDSLCFHCQQAVEKYLKSLLVFHKIHFEKIHDLWKLAKMCSRIYNEILEFEEELKTLNAYYIESRYPPEISVYTKLETKQAIKIVEKIAKFVMDRVT